MAFDALRVQRRLMDAGLRSLPGTKRVAIPARAKKQDLHLAMQIPPYLGDGRETNSRQ